MIPKIIHYCWFGGRELPEKAIICIDSWKKYCPDYEIIQWKEDNYNLDDIFQIPFLKKAYEDEKWSFVTDYIRLDVVCKNGGIYFDTDVELIKPIDKLLKYKAYFGFETNDTVNTGLGYGAEKSCALLKAMMDRYEKLPQCMTDEDYYRYTCPVIQTPVLLEYGIEATGAMQIVDGVAVYPKEYFCPLDYDTGKLNKTENTISIHRYEAAWKSVADKKVIELRNKLIPIFGMKNAWRVAVPIQYLRYKGIKETLSYYKRKISSDT